MMRRLGRLLATCAALVAFAAGAATLQGPRGENLEYSFAAFGDTPYSTEEEEQFVAMLAEINRSDVAFAIHVGDFKSANAVCDDAIYLQRRDWFTLSHHPLIYVPGDNEWTDCWRPFLSGYDPLERLARLRQLFFDTDQALGQSPLTLDRQLEVSAVPGARFTEHARWVYGRVAYASLNLPGGDNNRTRMPEEAARRLAAAREWMKSTFALARELRLPGIVLLMQANFWRPNGLPRPAFAELVADLAGEARRYRGQVLLVHGDTHTYRFDLPLMDPATRETVRNVTRLEVYGSPVVNWVRVRVTVEGDACTFTVSRGSRF